MILTIPKVESCDWYEQHAGDFSNVINAARNPVQCLSKYDAPLWAFYKPIPFPRLGYWDKPKFITANFECCFALLLDFDNDDSGTRMITIDDAIQTFSEFEYVLYTSYRHSPSHHKFRMVVPLTRPIDHTWFRCKKVKQWFVDKFPGVDILASIKTLQKHFIPAHHPSSQDYRFHINEAPRIDLPLEEFSTFIHEHINEAEQRPVLIPVVNRSSIFAYTLDEIESMNKQRYIIDKHVHELQGMSWTRGSGNDVHGNLCRIAASLQYSDVAHWYELIMMYAPSDYGPEVSRMQL